ncbi:methyltransferase domain-containing protein [Paenibacillus polygoni]|uniref:Methyltransferase domain-containing protein n=1 Tax=Paenibacillus polygoni TaxID=3050112 RepID=A0ABY8X6Z2_9BACL|nr:class I SAM-dependent methyltransferase [Paenibacillus polygoni]WIV21307.1 methyltransferase domain-containing protein [Paenibacillus polygoni]
MSHIIDYYSRFDEWGRLDREPLEFIVNMHFINKYLPQEGHLLDNGAGPGKYAMKLAQEGYRISISVLTPALVAFAREQAKNLQLESSFTGFHVQNATDLHELADNSFDASLMLGPMYHLQKKDERLAAVQELYRVTKEEGIVFVAFQSRTRMLFNSLQNPGHWKPNHTMEGIEAFLSSSSFTHDEPGRFTGVYYYGVEEIQPFMESNGFSTIELIGSTSIGGLLDANAQEYWKEQGEEAYQRVISMMIQTAADPSILGLSSHLLYIGRKNKIN